MEFVKTLLIALTSGIANIAILLLKMMTALPAVLWAMMTGKNPTKVLNEWFANGWVTVSKRLK